MADAMLRLLDESALAERMGAAARSRAAELDYEVVAGAGCIKRYSKGRAGVLARPGEQFSHVIQLRPSRAAVCLPS